LTHFVILDGSVEKGGPRYFEYEGKFCKNTSYMFTTGPGIDWREFAFEYSKIDEKTYGLTITVHTGVYPGQTLTPYEIKTRLRFESGIWKLEKILID
jgi:hypothetical protein